MINTIGQTERELTSFMNQKVKELEQTAKQQVASKIGLMQADIFSQYNSFVKSYIKKYFTKAYGNTNYNENSLMDSLTFKKNGFHSDFSYDKKFFKWNKDIKSDTDNFNLDESKESTYINGDDELDELEQIEDVDNDLIYEDYSSHNKKAQFDYYNKLNRQGAFQSLEDSYKKAYNEANKNFDKKMYTEIIPKLYQKYGIKLK